MRNALALEGRACEKPEGDTRYNRPSIHDLGTHALEWFHLSRVVRRQWLNGERFEVIFRYLYFDNTMPFIRDSQYSLHICDECSG